MVVTSLLGHDFLFRFASRFSAIQIWLRKVLLGDEAASSTPPPMPQSNRSNTAILIGSSNSSTSSGSSSGLIHRSASGNQALSGDVDDDKLNSSHHNKSGKRLERSGSLLDALPSAPTSSSTSSGLDSGLGSTIDVQISSSTSSSTADNRNSINNSGGGSGQVELSGLGASGLGAHIALVALSVFVAYLWMLGLKVVESSWSFLHQHSVLSSVRLFKVAMVAALLLVRLARPKLELRHTKVCL